MSSSENHLIPWPKSSQQRTSVEFHHYQPICHHTTSSLDEQVTLDGILSRIEFPYPWSCCEQRFVRRHICYLELLFVSKLCNDFVFMLVSIVTATYVFSRVVRSTNFFCKCRSSSLDLSRTGKWKTDRTDAFFGTRHYEIFYYNHTYRTSEFSWPFVVELSFVAHSNYDWLHVAQVVPPAPEL